MQGHSAQVHDVEPAVVDRSGYGARRVRLSNRPAGIYQDIIAVPPLVGQHRTVQTQRGCSACFRIALQDGCRPRGRTLKSRLLKPFARMVGGGCGRRRPLPPGRRRVAVLLLQSLWPPAARLVCVGAAWAGSRPTRLRRRHVPKPDLSALLAARSRRCFTDSYGEHPPPRSARQTVLTSSSRIAE